MQFAIAFGLIAVTVLIHALGTVETIAYASRAWKCRQGEPTSLASAGQLVRIISVLLVLHFLEAGVWALYYWLVAILPNLETALYFSLTSYTTVGYGDVVLPESSRFFGPIEGAVGILMFGWSTGIIVTVMHRIYGVQVGLAEDADGGRRGPAVGGPMSRRE